MTTGSLVRGTVQGVAGGLSPLGKINYCFGNPSGLIFAFPGSGISYDINSGSLFLAVSGTNSMDWIALVSGAY